MQLMGRSELLGTQAAEMTVVANSIVEEIDVGGDVGDSRGLGFCSSAF